MCHKSSIAEFKIIEQLFIIRMRLYTPLLTVISILMIAPARSEASPIAAADSTARAAAGVAPTDSVSTDVETLDEFVVTAKKKLVESDGAKLTYNVEEDP